MSVMNSYKQNTKPPMQPWYRHLWPWLLMAGPATVVVAGIVTAYIAFSTSDGLVEDDYYKQGLSVNQTVTRDRRADELGLQAEVVRSDDGMVLRVFLRAREAAVFPSALSMRITHPTRGGSDQNVVLHTDGAGFYSGKLSTPLNGRWHVALEDDKREWRLTGDWTIETGSTLQLPAVVKAAGSIDLHPDGGRMPDAKKTIKP
jgi:hypothetical protein